MKRLFTVSVILISFMLFGFVGASNAGEPYRIGAVFSLSGQGALLGDPEAKTVRMIADAVNDQGGIDGHPLEVAVIDDESDEEKSVDAVKELIDARGVIAILGPSLNDSSLAVVPFAEEAQTPLISCAASSRIVTANPRTSEQYKWIFKTAQSDNLAAEAIFSHMKKRKVSRIAVMTVDSGFGKSGREELLRLAPAFGINVVADETYGPRDTSMLSQLRKIKSLDHQAIVNWSIGPTQIIAMNNWRDLGMSVTPLYQSPGFGSPRNLALAGTAGEGVYCPAGACVIAPILPANHPQKKVTMRYWIAYKRTYKEPVSAFGGHAWDAFSMLIEALKAVGPDKEKIRDYLENLQGFVGQHGIFNFSPIDHNGLTREAFIMIVVRDGKWAMAD